MKGRGVNKMTWQCQDESILSMTVQSISETLEKQCLKNTCIKKLNVPKHPFPAFNLHT